MSKRWRIEKRAIIYPPRSVWRIAKLTKYIVTALLSDVSVKQIDEIKVVIKPLPGGDWEMRAETTVRE